MCTYEFEAEVADYDDLKRGITAAPRWTGKDYQSYSIVTVSAWAVGFNDYAAWWVAWLMVAAATGKMPTRIDMISFPWKRLP